MAIPSYVGAGSVSGGSGNVIVSGPEGEADDLELLIVQTSNQDLPATPDGFVDHAPGSPLGTGTAAAKDSTRLSVFYRWRDDETSPETSTGDSGDHQFAVIIRFRNVDPDEPFHQHNEDTSSLSASVTFPAVTTQREHCLIVNIVAEGTDNSGVSSSGESNSSLTDVTERVQAATNTGTGGGIIVITGGLETAGPSGSTTATLSVSSKQARLTLALRGVLWLVNDGTSPAWAANEGQSADWDAIEPVSASWT